MTTVARSPSGRVQRRAAPASPPRHPVPTGVLPGEAEAALRARVHLRTREIALLAGRRPPEVEQSDYEQAKREVSAEIAAGVTAPGPSPALGEADRTSDLGEPCCV
jgi:hypothetical protein